MSWYTATSSEQAFVVYISLATVASIGIILLSSLFLSRRHKQQDNEEARLTMSEKEPLVDIRGWEVKLVIISGIIIGVIFGFVVSQLSEERTLASLAPIIFGIFGGLNGFFATMYISQWRSGKHDAWRNEIRLRELRELDEEARLNKLREVAEAEQRLEKYEQRQKEEKQKKIEAEKHLANARIEGVVERL